MKTVIIDNYDSFTYNLSQLLQESGAEVTVLRNDKFRMEDLEAYDKIVLSPGPGIPEEAGLLLDVIRTYAGRKPILGICLGEQAIGEVFGGKLVNLSTVFHGIQSTVSVDTQDYLFRGLPHEIPVGRYHSWVVDKASLPPVLQGRTDYGTPPPRIRHPGHPVPPRVGAYPRRETHHSQLDERSIIKLNAD